MRFPSPRGVADLLIFIVNIAQTLYSDLRLFAAVADCDTQTLNPNMRLFAAVADAREIARQAKEAVEAKMSADGIQVPSNSIEFERGWKRVKGSRDKYLEYLAAIPLAR